MPDMLGINDYFVPEYVEHVWDVRIGQHLRLAGKGVRNNKIGSGGFGETFAVDGWLGEGLPAFPSTDEHHRQGRRETRCCLKVIGKTQITESDEAYNERAREEYQLLQAAHGANGRVPRPLGWGKVYVGTSPYWGIVMEYLSNGDGTYFLSDRDALANDRVQCLPGLASPLQVATFAYQLCLALRDLHTCQGADGITHRDLQPHNVAIHLGTGKDIPALADGTGIVDRVYLIDLGNSTTVERLVTPAFGDRAPRAATYQYGAPEVFDMYDSGNEGSLWRFRNNPTADIWSLGALIYHYATGEHPTCYDQSKTAPRDIATLPKADGLCIPQSRLDQFAEDPVATLLDGIVRACTVYDPRERAKRANISVMIGQLEAALGLGGIATRTPPMPADETPTLPPDTPVGPGPLPSPIIEPRRTMAVTAGPLSFQLLDSYRLQQASGNRQSFVRSDEEGRNYRFVCSWEEGVGTSDQRAYANALARRIDELFLHSNTTAGDDALVMLTGAGATVRPGKGLDPAYCTISFTVPQSGNESFVMQLHLYFVGDHAVMLGLGCRCPQDIDYDTKLLIEDEMRQVALSLR